jgi:hypothetical protein
MEHVNTLCVGKTDCICLYYLAVTKCLILADELGLRFWDHLYRKQPAAELDEDTDCGECTEHAILYKPNLTPSLCARGVICGAWSGLCHTAWGAGGDDK